MSEPIAESLPKSEKDKTITNARDLFYLLTDYYLDKKEIEEKTGFEIKEQKEIIEKDPRNVPIVYNWLVSLSKGGKELILKGFVSHRFNAGSEPQQITVEKNDFSAEELENLRKYLEKTRRERFEKR